MSHDDRWDFSEIRLREKDALKLKAAAETSRVRETTEQGT